MMRYYKLQENYFTDFDSRLTFGKPAYGSYDKSRRSEFNYLDNLNKLVNSTLTREQGLSENINMYQASYIECTLPQSWNPRTSTCPRSSSARTQPEDQMSIAEVYSVAPNISSGALQYLEQMYDILGSPLTYQTSRENQLSISIKEGDQLQKWARVEASYQNFSTSKVAQLKLVSMRIHLQGKAWF